jgi:molybdenum cofactor synthesis domain-containing protein
MKEVMDFVIISVGNELLSGDIVNSNAAYMAKKLTQNGHKVIRTITVPDNIEDIAEEIARARKKADFILVTGGLGVTHDDVTAEGIAKALDKKLVLNDVAFSFLKAKMSNMEAMKKIAMLPENSEVIENKVGAAPGFIVDNIAAMPGVPAEMEDVFKKLLSRFGASEYFEDRLRVKGFEDRILDKLNAILREFNDVEIGSYPKPGYVVIKFSGKDRMRVERAKKKLIELLKRPK